MNERKIQVTLSPPTWVKPEQTAWEWARIAHVRVIECRQVPDGVLVVVEGDGADVDTFKRIVRLNTAGW